MSNESKRHDKNNKHEMSEHDKKVIELLNIQAVAINIYLVADAFLYQFAAGSIQSADGENSGGESDIYDDSVFLVEGTYLSLLASLIISKVSFIAYDELLKNNKGIIDDFGEADQEIITASEYTVLLYYINSVGAAQLYYREEVCSEEVDEGWLEILSIQKTSYIIRIAADYLTLNATLVGIELVKSKYSDEKIDYSNIQDPDAIAIASAILYLIQRVMLFWVSIKVYDYMFDACVHVADAHYLDANINPVFGSFFGIIADILALDGFIKIYRINIDRPVFGR